MLSPFDVIRTGSRGITNRLGAKGPSTLPGECPHNKLGGNYVEMRRHLDKGRRQAKASGGGRPTVGMKEAKCLENEGMDVDYPLSMK